MLAKIWKRLLLIICIIAIIINVGHKMVSRTSVKEQLIELATTESLSTSIKNFVKEKFGEMKDEDKREFSDPVGEIVDVFKKDDKSSNDVDNSAVSTDNDNENPNTTEVNAINSDNSDENNNGEGNVEDTSTSGENGFTRFVQNIKTDVDDNPYFNDDPSDDLIDTTPPRLDF